MVEGYDKDSIESALLEMGWTVLVEQGALTIYQNNFYPPSDLVLKWSKDRYEWEDIQRQLDDQGIDCQPIYDKLCENE